MQKTQRDHRWGDTILNILGIVLLILLASTAKAQHHPQSAPGKPTITPIVSVHARVPGPGHPAEITVDANLTAPGQLVVDVAQTGAGGFARTELYDSVTQKAHHSIRTWKDDSYAVNLDDITVYVSTNGGTGFTTYNFPNIRPDTRSVSGLSVTPGDCTAELSWNAYSGAEGYRIWKRMGTEGRLKKITSFLADTTSMNIADSYEAWTGSPPRLHDGGVFFDNEAGKWRWIGIYNEGSWLTGDAHSFVNFSSEDLETWVQHDRIDVTDLAGADYKIGGYWLYHIWACQVIKQSGYYWLIYTGVDRMTHADPPFDPDDPTRNLSSSGLSPQRIFLSRAPVTADLDRNDVWEPVGMILQGPAPNVSDDPGWRTPTTYNPNGAWQSPCRDPFVAWDRVNKRWMMFVTCMSSFTGAEAVGAAYSRNLEGPWTWKGTIISTEAEPKAESPFVIRNSDGSYSLALNSGSTSVHIASSIDGNYSDIGNDVGDAIWDPLPFHVVGQDTFKGRPFKDAAQAEFCIAPGENQNLFMKMIYTYLPGDIAWSTTRMQFTRWKPMDIVEGTSWTDVNLSDGYNYGYAIQPVVDGGGLGLSAIEQITAESTTEIVDLTLKVESSLVSSLDIGWDMAPWSYRYRYDESADTDCEAAVSDQTFTTWTDVGGHLQKASIIESWTPTGIGYAHLQVQVKSQSSGEVYDDQECVSVYFEPPAPQVQNALGSYVGPPTDEIQLTWDPVSHPNLVNYRIQEIYDDGGGYDTYWYEDDDVAGWSKAAPGAGDYIYVIYSVCEVYGEEEASVGSNPPVVISGVTRPK